MPAQHCELYGCMRDLKDPETTVSFTIDGEVYVLKICEYHHDFFTVANPDYYAVGLTFTNEVELRDIPAMPYTPPPIQGLPGDSAYEIAVEEGFIGTVEEWLESLIGADGANGEDGTPGGPPGPEGPQGPPGADGIQGIQGIPGVDGIQGIQGIPGVDGSDGAPGIDGVDGADGIQGIQGIPGADGEDGAAGAEGPQGSPGADGNDGAPGADGEDGADAAFGAWANLTLATNVINAVSSKTGQVRLDRDTVCFKGRLQNTTGGTISAGTPWFTLPVGYRPTTIAYLVAYGGSSAVVLTVNTNGTVSAATGINNNLFLNLDGLSFDLS